MIYRAGHRGFATLTAIALLGFMAVALTMLITQIGQESRRTRQMIAEQQLQQLLLAGARVAQGRLQAGGSISASVEMPLPKELGNGEARLIVQRAEISGQMANVKVDARVGRHQRSEEITFDHSSGAWVMKSARLD